MIPLSLEAYADRGPDWAAWADRVPRLLRELLEEWALTPDLPAGAEPMRGHTALVWPVRTAAATNAYRHSPTDTPSRRDQRRLTARYANPDRTRRGQGRSEIQSGACGNACRQLRSRERVILFATGRP